MSIRGGTMSTLGDGPFGIGGGDGAGERGLIETIIRGSVGQALYRVVWRDEWIAEYLEEDNGDADVG